MKRLSPHLGDLGAKRSVKNETGSECQETDISSSQYGITNCQ